MIYTSSRGTKITIPDGLTPAQITAIKKDADAGYGTRAQQTANTLGKALTTSTTSSGTMSTRPTSSSLPTAQNPNQSATVAPPPTTSAGLTPRQETRLTWLLKNRPNDPQVKELQAIKAGATPNTNVGNDAGPDGGDAGPGGTTGGETVNPNGTVNQKAAEEKVTTSENEEWYKNWLREHPDETDEYGNTVHYEYDPQTGAIKRSINAGERGKFFSDQARIAAESFHGDEDRKKAEEATYGTLTKYYDRDMSREREQAQQEMANRGIPYDPAAEQDPNSKNLYGRTLGGIGEKYRGLKDTAQQQAAISGNQAYATDVAARDTTIRDSLAGAAAFGSKYGSYGNSQYTDNTGNILNIMGMTAQQYANKYGLDLQEAQSLRDAASRDNALAAQIQQWERDNDLGTKTLAAQVKDWNAKNKIASAAVAKSGSGGGGGTSTTTKPTSSGPTGFDVQF